MTNSRPSPSRLPSDNVPSHDGPGSPRPSVPTTVNAAFALFLLSALANIGSFLLLAGGSGQDQLRAQLRRAAAEGVTEADLQATQQLVVSVGITFAVVAAVVVGLVFLAFLMREGRSWARAALAVLSALTVVLSLTGIAVVDRTYWTNWTSLVCNVAAIVFMYLATSNQYFDRAAARRRRAQRSATHRND